MKLTAKEVELLVLSLNPLVEINRECNPTRAEQLSLLQEKLEKHYNKTPLRQAIEQAEKQDGWVLREVYFSEGEPIGHREPQWVGLTDEKEIWEMWVESTSVLHFVQNIDAKLKERNT